MESQEGKLSSLGLLSVTNATLAHPKNYGVVQRDGLRHVGRSACADERKAEFVLYTAHESLEPDFCQEFFLRGRVDSLLNLAFCPSPDLTTDLIPTPSFTSFPSSPRFSQFLSLGTVPSGATSLPNRWDRKV